MFGYYTSMILLLPAILLSVYAQGKVQSAYRTYANVRNGRNITGAEAAQRILQFNDLQIPIYETQGTLTDNYNPQKGTLNLSPAVYEQPSIASMAIAAHECGHALQHAAGYSLLSIRNSIVPVANIGSMLSIGYEKVLLLNEKFPDNHMTSEVISTFSWRIKTDQNQSGLASAAEMMNNVVGMLLVIGANTIARKAANTSLY